MKTRSLAIAAFTAGISFGAFAQEAARDADGGDDGDQEVLVGGEAELQEGGKEDDAAERGLTKRSMEDLKEGQVELVAPGEEDEQLQQTPPPATDRQPVENPQSVDADQLIDATVYGANNEDIGSVGDVLLSEEGEIRALVVDVGGFLGLGTKEVALEFQGVGVIEDDGALAVQTRFTEEVLEQHPPYDEEGYLQGDSDLLPRAE